MEDAVALSRRVKEAVIKKGGKVIYEYDESFGDPDPGPSINDIDLPPTLREALRSRGIERLYKFQWETISEIEKGHNVVVVAGTGTGKTEAFMIPTPSLTATPQGRRGGEFMRTPHRY